MRSSVTLYDMVPYRISVLVNRAFNKRMNQAIWLKGHLKREGPFFHASLWVNIAIQIDRLKR